MQGNKQTVVDEVVGIPTKDIIIGTRFRQRYNNIDELAESIAAHGLLNPITVTPYPDQEGKYILVSGGRRLKAFEKNKARVIPTIIKAGCAAKLIEAEENNQRDPFTPLEQLTIAETILEGVPDRRGRPKNGEEETDVVVEKINVPTFGNNFPPTVLRKGEKTLDLAIRVAGFSGRAMYEKVKKIRDEAIPDVLNALERRAISVNCAHEIALEKPEAQLSRLNESIVDDDIDRKKLRELNRKRREEKRLAAKHIRAQERPSEFQADDDDIYNLIYFALGSNTKQKDIDALAKFPLHIHGKGEMCYCDLLVAISCPNEKLDLAVNLIEALKLDYIGMTTICRADQKPVSINELGKVSSAIVFAQFEPGKNQAFEDARVPYIEHSAYPHLHPKAFLTKYFGVEKPLLDVTAPKGADTLGDVWINYADKYYDVK